MANLTQEVAGLTKAQLSEFNERGYLLVDNLLDPERDLDPIIDEYSDILDGIVVDLFGKGEIKSLYSDLPFAQRLTRIQHESSKTFTQHFEIALPKRNVKLDTPVSVGGAVFGLIRNERLLDVVESLIGSEIYANPIQHVRMKQPLHLNPKAKGRLRWHQDNAFMMPDADNTEVVTLWIPLLDATVQNGCLKVVPYSHRSGLLDHCATGVHIPEHMVASDTAVPIPVQRGGVLFMHRCMIHEPLANHSDTLRWSFDLRYNPDGKPSGRDVQPGFVARSRKNPESEIRDPSQWAEMWHGTRVTLAGQPDPTYERWQSDDLGCA